MAKAQTSSEFKIDKGVPLPPRSHNRRYRFAEMEIDDSAFLPNTIASGVHSRVQYLKPKKFTVRSVVEGGVKGVRIWRIK